MSGRLASAGLEAWGALAAVAAALKMEGVGPLRAGRAAIQARLETGCPPIGSA